jgi:hypothetical protein
MRVSKVGRLAGLVVALAACQGVSEPQMSRVSVLLTDAASPALQSANVSVSTVYLVGADGTTRDTITTSGGDFDLLQLQNGITTLLGSATIPAGDYEQLRLVVTSANVTLADGYQFSDGTTSRDLKIPSGPQTGIKVDFGGPVQITAPSTTLVVDFVVDQSFSFVFTGPSSAPNDVLFKPVLHGTVTP